MLCNKEQQTHKHLLEYSAANCVRSLAKWLSASTVLAIARLMTGQVEVDGLTSGQRDDVLTSGQRDNGLTSGWSDESLVGRLTSG